MGFLTFMHIYNLRLGPEPLSPFLLQLLLDGTAFFTYDDRFVRQLSPSTTEDLQPWTDWDRVGPLPVNSSRLSQLLAQFEINVSC